MSLTDEQRSKIALVCEETGFLPAAAAFVLGRTGGNVEEAIAYLSALAEEDDGPLEATPS